MLKNENPEQNDLVINNKINNAIFSFGKVDNINEKCNNEINNNFVNNENKNNIKEINDKDNESNILKYNSIDLQAYFQTAWFIECIVSETLMIFYIRTNHITKSRPSNTLLVLTVLTIIATILVPILLSFTGGFNFVILPPIYYLYLIGFVVLYGFIAQTVKKIYIKKYNEWL